MAVRTVSPKLIRCGGIVIDVLPQTRLGAPKLMDELIKIGFQEIGKWQAGIGGLEYGLTKHRESRPALYAFVVDDQVMYVGKTKRTLNERMYQYLRGSGTQVTNIRVRGDIETVLAQGKQVVILGFVSDDDQRLGPFRLNLPAALEDDIIDQLNPPWNGGLQRARLQPPTQTVPGAAQLSPSPVYDDPSAFEVAIGTTYHRKGFFNVPVSHSELLGPDGSGIAIVAPNLGLDVLGKINRSVNPNRTPRIMGGNALRNWLQSNVALNQSIRVRVKSAGRIELEVA